MCCVAASFVRRPSCVAFPFDALHVDCFAILRLQQWLLLVVAAGATAAAVAVVGGVHWLDRRQSGQLQVELRARLSLKGVATVLNICPKRPVQLGAFRFAASDFFCVSPFPVAPLIVTPPPPTASLAGCRIISANSVQIWRPQLTLNKPQNKRRRKLFIVRRRQLLSGRTMPAHWQP